MDVKIISIDNIGLSVRASNALHRAQVFSVGDLLKYNEESLTEIRNLGKKSIEEILNKIEEYKIIDEMGGLPDESDGLDESSSQQEIQHIEDFKVWINNENNRKYVINWLKQKEIRIDRIKLLSTRAYNVLLFAGYEYIYQIAFLSKDELMTITHMDGTSASEIEKLTLRFVSSIEREISDAIEKTLELNKKPSLSEILQRKEYRDAILQFVKANDMEIERMSLSNRAKNCLQLNQFKYMSDIIFLGRNELQKMRNMGKGSVEEVVEKINDYLNENESRIMAVIDGDESALWSDENIRKKILDTFNEIEFAGLSLNEMQEKLSLSEYVTVERLKSIIGKLIAENKLEYVDYRCHRVYGSFEDYLALCEEIDERSRECIRKRLQGKTLEAIAQEYGLTRERVRQIVKKDVSKIRNYYFMKTGMSLFDEDYYRYLYENYDFEKSDATKWLGIPLTVFNYLDLNDVKRGKKDLNLALEDISGLSVGLRLKIKNYLNRNKLYINGMWIDRKRSELERVVVEKYCKEDTSFDEYYKLYNSFLEQEEITYDESIYYTDSVYKTRKNHLTDQRFLLWKQYEKIRYYDIDGQDYSELLDTINIGSFENTEISTLKLMREYPDVMKKYDIRDQYELHNLLRKIVPEGSYNDFHCSRMPEIRFGSFDRNSAIMDILIDNSPISLNDLADLISKEYGYDPAVIMANYLKDFSEYYHNGIYSVDQKQMSQENKNILQKELTEDFYFIDEIRQMYSGLIPGADTEEINPYNLKNMGFSVYSRYALKNYSSLDHYFNSILTNEDIMDITGYRKRYCYVQLFSQKLMELKRSLQIIEFEPNQIIGIKRLEKFGVTKEKIQEFCDRVFDFVQEGEYFSLKSIKSAGFENAMFDLGFSDWFYSNLLISDDRLTTVMMYGNLIHFKGNERTTIKSFETTLIQKHGSIDVYDLIGELTDIYGCKISDRLDVIYKVKDTEVYYDKILDRMYANKDIYYEEIEKGVLEKRE